MRPFGLKKHGGHCRCMQCNNSMVESSRTTRHRLKEDLRCDIEDATEDYDHHDCEFCGTCIEESVRHEVSDDEILKYAPQ